MVDKRKPWETKTFYASVGVALLVVLQGLGISLPYDELYKLAGTFGVYSVADRLKK